MNNPLLKTTVTPDENVKDTSMNSSTSTERSTLLFQRLYVSSIQEPAVNDAIRDAVLGCAERVGGEGVYRPVSAHEVLDDSPKDVLFFAIEGMAVSEGNADSLRAVYLLLGNSDDIAETKARIQSRGDIDFEGNLQTGFLVEQRIAELDNETGDVRVVRGAEPSEPYSAHRLDGEQSEFFSRVEEISLVVSTLPGVPNGSLEYEPLMRRHVSTPELAEPRLYKRSDLESATVLGEGVLIWPSVERQTDRYGFIQLHCEPSGSNAHIALRLDDLVGVEGTLLCEVMETRHSNVADFFRGFSAEMPNQGELIELGKGSLAAGEANTVGCKPSDGREIDWLNPRALYRCHLQTVRLYFLPTEIAQ